MLKLIKKYCLPNYKEIFLIVFFSIISSLFLLLLPIFFSLILGLIKNNFNLNLINNDIAIQEKSLFNLNYLYNLINTKFDNLFIDISFINKIFIILFVFIIICFLASLFRYLSIYYTYVSELKTRHKIRLDLKEKIFSFDYSYFKKLSSGSLTSVFVKDVEEASIITGSYIRAFSMHFSMIFLILIFLVNTNYLLTFVLFFIFLLHYLYNLIFKKIIFLSSKEFYLKLGEVTGKLQDLFHNFKIIKVFFAENKKKQLSKNFEDLNEKEIKIKLLSGSQEPIRMFLDNLSIIFLISVIIIFIFLRKISIEGAILFLVFCKFAQTPISGISTALIWTESIKASYNRIKKILSYKSKIKFGVKKIEMFKKSIKFKNVNFAYDNNVVLSNVNFELKKNNHYVINGENGTGKSTIIDLILGLQKPNKGEILIDEQNIRNFKHRDYLNLFSLVTQDSYLINDTIEANILIGSLKKNIYKKDLEELIINLNSDFIFKLPKGLKTIIDESGSSLSGGQKQKICILRSLINNPEIIIFDEVLSNQDEKSKKDITNLIKNLSKSKTIIEVSHEKIYKKRHNFLNLDRKKVELIS